MPHLSGDIGISTPPRSQPAHCQQHLEQIYATLGVENLTSATAIAIRALDQD